MTTVAPFPAAPDWSTGTYETTAEQLRPAAAVLAAAHRYGFLQIERDEPESFPVMPIDARFHRRRLIVSTRIDRNTTKTLFTPSPSAT